MQVTSYNVVTKYSCGTSFKEVDADQLIPKSDELTHMYVHR